MENRDRLLLPKVSTFACALRGMALMVSTQPNVRFHLAATVVVFIAGACLQISSLSWLWLLLSIAIVWIAEGLNTSIEMLADALHPEIHPGIGNAKDVAAASVLIAAVFASLIGICVLYPYVAALL